jgi:hypothetical protein
MGQAVSNLENVTDWVRVFKTAYVFAEYKPLWESYKLKMTTLCNNNKTLPIRLTVKNFSNVGTHVIYGSVITSIREIEMGRTKLCLESPRQRPAGYIKMIQLKMDLRPTLLAYLHSGWRISCGISIDFTLSNRPYNDPRSNHR